MYTVCWIGSDMSLVHKDGIFIGEVCIPALPGGFIKLQNNCQNHYQHISCLLDKEYKCNHDKCNKYPERISFKTNPVKIEAIIDFDHESKKPLILLNQEFEPFFEKCNLYAIQKYKGMYHLLQCYCGKRYLCDSCRTKILRF